MSRTRKVILSIIIAVVTLILGLPLSMYIPFVQDWMCQGVVEWLNTSTNDIQFSVGKVRIGFPLKLKVEDVSAVRTRDGQTLFGLQLLEAGLDDIPLDQPYFIVNDLRIEGVMVAMDSISESLGVLGGIDAVRVRDVKVNPAEQAVRIGEVNMQNPGILLYLAPAPADTVESEGNNWSVNVDRVLLREGSLELSISDSSLVDALSSVSTIPYLDHHHLSLNDISLDARNVEYWQTMVMDSVPHSDMHVSLVVDSLRAREDNSSVNLRQASLDFRMNGPIINVDSVLLELDKSSLSGNAVMNLALMDSIQEGMIRANVKAEINHSELSQLAYGYVPEVLHQWVNGDVKLKAEVNIPSGIVDAQVSYGDSLLMKLIANVDNDDFDVKARMVEGKTEILNAQGKANIKDETYRAKIDARNLNIGHFLPDIAVHRLDAHAEVEGRHYKVPGRHTHISANADLERVTFTDQTGKRDSLVNVVALLSLNKGRYMTQVVSKHPKMELEAYSEGLLLPDTVSASGNIDLPDTDLANLPAGLANEDLGRLSLEATFNGGWNWKNWANLHIAIDTLKYRDRYSAVSYGDIEINGKSDPELMYAYLKGGDARLDINVKTNITKLPGVATKVQKEVEQQYADCRINVADIEKLLPEFDVKVDMEQDNLLYGLVQYYGYEFDKIHLKANNRRNLNVEGMVVGLIGDDGLDIDSAMFRIKPHADKKQVYDVSSHVLRIAAKAKNSYNIHTRGELWPDSAIVDFKYEDGNFLTRYDATLSVGLAKDSVTVHLEKDPVLYGERFIVNKDNFLSVMNFIDIDEDGLNSRARILLDGEHGTSLHVYSRTWFDERLSLKPKAPIAKGNQLLVVVKDADLSLMGRDLGTPGLMSGKMSVAAAATLFPDSLTMAMRVQSNKFKLKTYEADSITFNGRVDIIGLQGDRDHHIGAKGVLKVEDDVKVDLRAALADSIDVQATIKDLPLELSNMMLPDDVALRGFLNGQVTVRGKDVDNTRMDGILYMKKGGIEITDLDANLSISEDSVRLRNNRLRIRGLSLIGTNKNRLSLSGSIDMSKSLSNPTIDLSLQGKDVRIIDSKKLRTRNQYIYGRLPVTVDMNVLGRLDKLKVKGQLSVLSGTNLTCYLQDDPLQQQSKVDGLVEFVNFRQLDRQSRVKKNNVTEQPKPIESASNDELDVQFVVDIARDAKVRAYLPGPEKNNAFLTGGGQIKVIYDGNDRLQTSGFYDVSDGTLYYKLPVIPMSKNFKITNSSSLNWNGQLDNPHINIQATEEVKATVNDESAGSRIVRFLVTIDISGTLSALDLKFKCASPEDGTLNTELAAMTEDENSKAAIMLLLAQTYMGPGSTSSMGLSTANSAVSSIINKQIESAFGTVAPQVDLGIDTYDTEAGGQRTEYSVKVSQKFGDRFRATIGGKVSQGAEAAGRSKGAQLGDISFEWLIKKDGSHYLRLFRKTNYESVLEGEIIETGAGYVQETSGYRFRDLLIPASKKRQESIQKVIKELQEKERQEERLKEGIRSNGRRRQRGSQAQSDSIQHAQSDSILHENVKTDK